MSCRGKKQWGLGLIIICTSSDVKRILLMRNLISNNGTECSFLCISAIKLAITKAFWIIYIYKQSHLIMWVINYYPKTPFIISAIQKSHVKSQSFHILNPIYLMNHSQQSPLVKNIIIIYTGFFFTYFQYVTVNNFHEILRNW